MSKYTPLEVYLSTLRAASTRITFSEIDAILGSRLPPSAYRYGAFWSNSAEGSTHVWADAWQKAGWQVSGFDLEERYVDFRRYAQSLETDLFPSEAESDMAGKLALRHGTEVEGKPASAIPDVADDPEFTHLLESIPETERDAIIKVRIGQGPYRDALYARWGGCSVTDVSMKELLTASHIKPWRHCKETPADRVNVANGLLLVPTLDRLFDRGFITFHDDFTIRLSSRLQSREIRYLKLDTHIRLRLSDFTDIRPYLDWHRMHVFQY